MEELGGSPSGFNHYDNLVPERVEHVISRILTNNLNAITFGEGREPKPTSAGATAVVRSAVQNLQ